MQGLPLLSIITFLPVVGALLILVMPGGDRTARLIALITTAIDFVLSLVLWANFDPATSDFQFIRILDLARRQHHLQDGRRRDLDALRRPDRVPDADQYPRE